MRNAAVPDRRLITSIQPRPQKPMPLNQFWTAIARHINAVVPDNQVLDRVAPIAGGDISEGFRLSGPNANFFVKLNKASALPLFHAEEYNLQYLDDFAPQPICSGVVGKHAFLAIEYLPLADRGDHSSLGKLVAKLHQRCSETGQYGWPQANFIGLTPQTNDWHSRWSDFWWHQRCKPQLDLAYSQGHRRQLEPRERALRDRVDDLLANHQPPPALLHGDLWNGNKGFLNNGKPTLFDPASYYGDPETDLAMTRLFGGFDKAFYDTYHQTHPRLPGHQQRQHLYQLYHVLNHLNLFGGGYLGQATLLVDKLLEDKD